MVRLMCTARTSIIGRNTPAAMYCFPLLKMITRVFNEINAPTENTNRVLPVSLESFDQLTPQLWQISSLSFLLFELPHRPYMSAFVSSWHQPQGSGGYPFMCWTFLTVHPCRTCPNFCLSSINAYALIAVFFNVQARATG